MKKSSQKSIHLQIREILLDDIKKNIFKEGDKIPSYPSLSRQLKVAPMTVRRAIQSLVEEGALYCQSGKGTFVTSKEQTSKRIKFTDIGIVFPHTKLGNRFFNPLYKGCEKVIHQKPYTTLLMPYHNSPEEEAYIFKKIIDRQCAGVWLCPQQTQQEIKLLKEFSRERIPYILTDKIKSFKTNFICDDGRAGGYIATKYLIDLGHRRIGYMGLSDSLIWAMDRLEGYKKALIEHNLSVEGKLIKLVPRTDIFKPYNYKDTKKNTLELLEERVTAIFVSVDFMVLNGIYPVLLDQLKIRIPEDVDIIGYDDIVTLNYELSIRYPPFKTMRINREKIGEMTGYMLTHMIEEHQKKKRIEPSCQISIEPILASHRMEIK